MFINNFGKVNFYGKLTQFGSKLSFITAILFAFVLTLVGNPILAEDVKKDEKSKQEAKADAGDYLERFHAKDNAAKLIGANKAEIFRLKVIIANFGESEGEKELAEIFKQYKEGIKLYYTNNYVTSSKRLSENAKNISILYKKMIDIYKKQTQELLSRCADMLVDTELRESIEPGLEQQLSEKRTVHNGKIKLQIAYDQYNMGTEAERLSRNAQTIAHLRVAKYHGITMLMSMAKNEEERKQIGVNYKVQLMDTENKAQKEITVDLK